MIKSEDFLAVLSKFNIDFFCGVPDSLLQNFCACLDEKIDEKHHIITANEGNAIALASGHYLATKRIGLVYMQNSGLGNSINPLVSLADDKVYSIPILLVIGWRGEPEVYDEPQHITQGKITLDLLETLAIQYDILPANSESLENCIENANNYLISHQQPFALIVRKNTFSPYLPEMEKEIEIQRSDLSREEAIKIVVDHLNPKDVIISTTGKTSRELFEYESSLPNKQPNYFITVGSMGHASHIALGVALEKQDRTVFCIDGDGSIIMHMGSLGIIGNTSPKNFIHIVMNNGTHESVGGQPTVGYFINFLDIAKASGYKNTTRVTDKEGLIDQLKLLQSLEGPSFLEIIIKNGSRDNLGRPTLQLKDIKNNFMEFLER